MTKEKKHQMHFELTQPQHRLLSERAKQCGLSKRAYLVRLIEGTPIKARPSQEVKELRTEIHHIGNNINRALVRAIAKPAWQPGSETLTLSVIH